jgi:hypothetical protein
MRANLIRFPFARKGMPMVSSNQIREKMEVVGSDGKHVGTVDRCENDRIKLTKNDPAAQGQHHYLDLSSVDRIEGNRICLSTSAEEAMQRWQPA